MVDFETIKLIQKYLDCEYRDWKMVFEEFCGKENLNIFLRADFDLTEVPLSIPQYYLDSMKLWHELQSHQEPLGLCGTIIPFDTLLARGAEKLSFLTWRGIIFQTA